MTVATATVRKARQSDAAGIADLLNLAYPPVWEGWVPVTEASVKATMHNAVTLVAAADNMTIGTILLQSLNPRELYAHHLAVHPEHRKQGIGTLLLRTVAASALVAGKTAIMWHSLDTMTDAHSLYLRLGATTNPFLDVPDPGGHTGHYFRWQLTT